VKCLLRDGLLDASRSLFEYGCGHGQDLELLGDLGVAASGWDPVFRSDTERSAAELVYLGYVINVIEDPQERDEALRTAWALCRSVMVVAALGMDDGAACAGQPFADGVLTSRGTFQGRYRHAELKAYLEQTLSVDAVAAAPNVYYVFRSEELRLRFESGRFRRTIAAPRLRVADALYEQHRGILDALISAVTSLGRLPGPEELPVHREVVERFGSVKRAFLGVRRVTGGEPWAEIVNQRRADLLVVLAMAQFGRRRQLGALPMSMQRDIRAFLGTYSSARERARQLLFSVGDAGQADAACVRSPIGALVDNGLLVLRRDHGQSLCRTLGQPLLSMASSRPGTPAFQAPCCIGQGTDPRSPRRFASAAGSHWRSRWCGHSVPSAQILPDTVSTFRFRGRSV